jgi:hypothetical protein
VKDCYGLWPEKRLPHFIFNLKDDDDERGEGSSLSQEEETSDEDEDEGGDSEEEEGQMMAPPPPSAGGLATIGRSTGPGGPPKQLYTVLREAAVDGRGPRPTMTRPMSSGRSSNFESAWTIEVVSDDDERWDLQVPFQSPYE